MKTASTIKRTLTTAQKKICAASQKWVCGHCEIVLPASFEVDHIRPIWNGGTDDPANLVALCGSCHKEKTYKENSERTLAKRRLKDAEAFNHQFFSLFKTEPTVGIPKIFPAHLIKPIMQLSYATEDFTPLDSLKLPITQNAKFSPMFWTPLFNLFNMHVSDGPGIVGLQLKEGIESQLRDQVEAERRAKQLELERYEQQQYEKAKKARVKNLFEQYKFTGPKPNISTRG